MPLATAGPDPLADAIESLPDISSVAHQQALQILRQRSQAVLEVSLRPWLALLSGVGLAQRRVAVGKQSGHRQQVEMRKQLLLHQALAPAVELLDL